MTGVFLGARGIGWEVAGKRIVDSVSLSVDRGELVGIIGPNGAGKTTLLRLVSGLLEPTSGQAFLEGMPVSGMSFRERARRVAFMAQDPMQSFPYTVTEILLMGRYPHLRRFQRETAEDRERALRTLSYVGLSGFEDRRFGELSGGERQLVLFARALVQDTDLLVLDEPSSSLDIRHQDRIFSMAQEIAREKRAVLVSVHNLNVAGQYCSRLVLLEKGTVAAEGRPEEVLVQEILDRVYGVRTLVSPSMATGSMTVTVVPWRLSGKGARIHLIGGAGSAINLTRELYRLGYSLSAGIVHQHDSDEKLWVNLAVECFSVGAFSRITEEDVEKAAPLVEKADLTILCSFPVGPGNIGNLRLAARARRLVILKPGPEDLPRSFISAEGEELFRELCGNTAVQGYEEILQELGREFGAAGDRT